MTMRFKKDISCTHTVRKNSFLHTVQQNKILLLMLVPAVMFYIIFHYLPMFGAVLAFKSYDYSLGILKSPFVGLENFKFFFTTGQAWTVTRNTVLYNLAFILLGNLAKMIVAIFLAEISRKYFKKTVQTCILFPNFISWVVVGALAYNIFSYDYGLLNAILNSIGIEPINVYTMPKAWPFILVIFDLWKGVGYGSIVYLATLTGMDTSIYEAADIDGATIWQRIRCITIPALMPTTITLVLLALGRAFRGSFDMFYQLIGNNGLLFSTTDIIDTYTFRSLLFSNDIGMTSAIGLYQSVLCFVFIMLSNYVVKKIDEDSSLF